VSQVYAHVGDQIIVENTRISTPKRDGEILEIHGKDGGPPYVVRWSDTGHTALVFPGPDAHIHHLEHT
jgi:hypothetical protein